MIWPPCATATMASMSCTRGPWYTKRRVRGWRLTEVTLPVAMAMRTVKPRKAMLSGRTCAQQDSFAHKAHVLAAHVLAEHVFGRTCVWQNLCLAEHMFGRTCAQQHSRTHTASHAHITLVSGQGQDQCKALGASDMTCAQSKSSHGLTWAHFCTAAGLLGTALQLPREQHDCMGTAL